MKSMCNCLCKRRWNSYNFTVFSLLQLLYPPSYTIKTLRQTLILAFDSLYSLPLYPSPLILLHSWQNRTAYVFTVLSCARSKLKSFVNLTASFISPSCGTVCLHKLRWQVGWRTYTYLEKLQRYQMLAASDFELDPLLKKEIQSVINILRVLFSSFLRRFPLRAKWY